MPQRYRLGVIIGSVRSGRGGQVVADWFVREAENFGAFAVDVIDAREYELSLGFGDALPPKTPPHAQGLTQALDEADAFVVVTPEYNHSYPAGLKNLIDWHHRVWHAKPVGFVSYGGIAGGLRAVEHLRCVFAEVHAVTIRDSVSFANYWERYGPGGDWPREPEGSNLAAKKMLDQLAWWTQALTDAKQQRPYVA